MRADHWQRLEAVFSEARAHRDDTRGSFLDQACDRDPALRHEVDSLLDHEPSTDHWRASFADLPASGRRSTTVGDSIGPYRLVRVLGEGGMGQVFLGVREDGAYRRQVAIKVIHPWVASEDLAQRLRRERQILAGLRHPAIVALHDGGATDDGDPYLVMDHVDGLPIHRYCEQHRLDARARVALLLPVCEAVHHAHQNLVVHRDLKPANILISSEGQPFLLDFGIAKILNRGIADSGDDETAGPRRLLTPSYASPEQLSGAAVTTASDVYSLGALLYRLLAGRPPHDLSALSPAAAERAVCSTVPEPPSKVQLPGVTRGRGDRRLAGDLDAIVVKAMHRDPDARYASVDQLRDDLENALADRPLRARRHLGAYRVRAFVGRYRKGLALAAAVVMALTAMLVVAIVQARAAQSLRHTAEAARVRAESLSVRAEAERGRAEAVSGFLLELFQSEDRSGQMGTAIEPAVVLARGLDRIAREQHRTPAVRAALLDTLGQVSLELGQVDRAEALFDQALTQRRVHLGPTHGDVASSLRNLAGLHHARGDLPVAESLLSQALEIGRLAFGQNHPEVGHALHLLGVVRQTIGDLDAAEAAYREALTLRVSAAGGPGRLRAETMLALGELLAEKGDLDAARVQIEASLGIRRQLHGDQHPGVAEAMHKLGRLAESAGDLETAEDWMRRALTMSERFLGGTHTRVAALQNDLGLVLFRRGRLAEAEAALELALVTRQTIFDADHYDVADTLTALALVRKERGAHASALEAHRRALAIYRKACGVGSQAEATVLNNIALVLLAQDEHREAERLMMQALDTRRSGLGSDDPRVGNSLISLGELRLAQGRYHEALRHFEDGLGVFVRGLGETHWRSGRAASLLGASLVALGQPAEAREHLRQGFEILRATLGDDHPRTRRAHAWLGPKVPSLAEPATEFAALTIRQP